jgi:hypothetical protein
MAMDKKYAAEDRAEKFAIVRIDVSVFTYIGRIRRRSSRQRNMRLIDLDQSAATQSLISFFFISC